MCRPTSCRTCGKTTWSGCGMHVADVRASVPDDQWCGGHEAPPTQGWLRRIRGR